MSNIYIQEPPTDGKVVLKTTLGDMEIELWPKQAPKACRNFIQHCLDGFYNDCPFHRVIPKFIAQTGDPFGDGGKAAFEDAFEIETHQRLRFTHRGLVAMAADTQDHNNKSQFFITLDRTPELEAQHTIFGKIVGDTIYNALKFNDLEIGDGDRPEFPPVIRQVEIIRSPFDDLIARPSLNSKVKVTASSSGDKKEESERERRIREARERKGVRNQKLLSFDDDGSGGNDGEVVQLTGKKKSMHDLLPSDQLRSLKRKRKIESASMPVQAVPTTSTTFFTQEPDDSKVQGRDIDEQEVETVVREEKSKSELLSEIEQLKRELYGKSISANAADAEKAKLQKKGATSKLEEERRRQLDEAGGKGRVIMGGKRGRVHDENEVLKKLSSFTSKLKSVASTSKTTTTTTTVKTEKSSESEPGGKEMCKLHNVPKCSSCKAQVEILGDADQLTEADWLSHKLKFDRDLLGKNLLDKNSRRIDNVEDLVVIDPLARREQTLKKNINNKTKK